MKEASDKSMIKLIDFTALNRLQNTALRPNWPDNMSYQIRHMQMAAARSRSRAGSYMFDGS